MDRSAMTAKIEQGDGFIAALDQSGGSTPKALKGYGIEEGAWGSDEEMFDLIHQMRERIITAPCFGSGKVLGAILFERTMDGTVDGKPTPQALIDLGIVPFIKIDKGLEPEENGVQMMKPIPDLDALLERAKRLGVFGTKERSVINAADKAGIAVLVAQQFQLARQVLAHGMVPIIEPEVNIKSADRDESDQLLLAAILEELDEIPEGERVMLKLSTPGRAEPVRAAGRASQSAARRRACRAASVARGSVPRAGEESGHDRELQPRVAVRPSRHSQSDEEFNRTLGTAIDEIYEASTEKVTA